MSTPAPEAANPYARLRAEPKEGGPGDDRELSVEPGDRRLTVSLRAVLDVLSMWFIVAGGALGVAAAALAGGTVPALATAGGVLVGLGLLLTL